MTIINQQALQLINQQTSGWELAATNYAGLSSVKQRELVFNGFSMYIQFNPERIRSSAAKVDAQSIRQRQCFLCTANLPSQQQMLAYPPHYNLLVNPFPIFKKHLTIPVNQHVDQLIEGRIGNMLQLAKDLPDFVIFYNGPKCGASAPDHFHFQAGNKGMLPIETDFESFKNKILLYQSAQGKAYTMEGYLRKTLVFTSTDANWVEAEFYRMVAVFAAMQPAEVEPMLNLLATYNVDTKEYNLFVFPRAKHRPSQFFEEGDAQVVFSPASVDFGGLLITPREEDYMKLTAELVTDMFAQVTLADNNWAELKEKITP